MTTSASATTNTSTREAGPAALYRIIWRWHFYAGLFCIPFVLTLAISGSIYLFKPQIDAWVDRAYHQLPVGDERASPSELIEVALGTVEGSRFLQYQLQESDRHAVIVAVEDRGEKVLVYLNPYTEEVLKVIGYESQFIRVVRTFHGELLAGTVGSVLVELAACWAIVLVLSGLYLWWPRSAEGLAGIVYPRLKRRGRLLWRDLHAVTGFWISMLALFLLITALPWALVWSSAFNEVRTAFASLDSPAAQHQHHHEHDPTHAAAEPTWTVSRAEEQAAMERQARDSVVLSPQVVAAAQALNFAPPALLSVAPDDPAVWRLTSDHQNRRLRDQAWLDGKSGKVLRIHRFAEQPLIDRVIGTGTAAHEGQLFGWFNQALALFTTIGLVTLSISGFLLWRKRKPTGVLGAPPAMPNAQAGKAVAGIVLLMALLLPLLAASLLVLFALEWLLLRRSPQLGKWLGTA